MKNKTIITIISIILLLTTTNHTVSSEHIKPTNITETIYVDDDNTEGPWDGTKEHPYENIKDAIQNSTKEDIIYVLNGTYHENFNIDKSIKLIGENKRKTIIEGDYSEIIINITAENVTINHFTIRNSNGYKNNCGIKSNTNNNKVINCIIYRTKSAIFLKNVESNTINNCSLYNNADGIYLESSNNNRIKRCIIGHNSIGVNTEKSNDVLLEYCYFHTNGISCYFNDSSNNEIYHCNISDNSANLGGIYVVNSKNIIIKNCNLMHNGAGVCTFSSEDISVINSCLCLNTHFAFAMRTKSNNINITNCKINNNLRYGFYIEEDNNCNIHNNNIIENTLLSIKSKTRGCKAQYNWWGSPFGPSYTEFRLSSKITFMPGRVKYLPWSFKTFENIGSDWTENEPYNKDEIDYEMEIEISFEGTDTDDDGIPDWWEEKHGYDPFVKEDHKKLDEDEDALNNFQECFAYQYGADPKRKDIFLEVDWMESLIPGDSNKPPEDLIQKLINIFEEHDIALHIDTGQFNGGEEIPFCESLFSFVKLRDLYWEYFLKNNLSNPHKNIFRYCIICNYCPDLNFPFFGWDNLDSFAISALWLKELNPFYSKEDLIVGAMVHHLGHTLGLLADTYDGIDNVGASYPFTKQWWKYKNYKSCMNYFYKYRIFSFSDGNHGYGDFNDWDNLDFKFFQNSNFNWLKNQEKQKRVEKI